MAVRLAPVSGRSTLLPLCYGGLASPSVALLSPGSPFPGSAGHRSLAKKNKIGPLKFVNDQNNFEASIPRVHQLNSYGRRELFGWFLGLSYLFIDKLDANAAGLPPEEKPALCDDACGKELENVPIVTTESGLQYRDIKVGRGPTPPVGFQVIANYVAMVPSGQVFDSSLEKAEPYLFRVGAGQVVKGLDEGILGMKVGGKRRLYIPGPLAFPKGLTSAPGRPRVPPSSPVIFDVSLEYIPGLDFEDE